jgi:aminopeptidase YwaD
VGSTLTCLALTAGLLVAVPEASVQEQEGQDSKTRSSPAREGHRGPGVIEGEGGPARFLPALLSGFRTEAADELLRFTDGFYRTPGNPGYDAVLDRVQERLRESGFGEREGFELELIETKLSGPAWTPKSGRLEALVPGAAPVVLHAFERATDPDRVMLPMYAPAADVEGRVVFEAADVAPGTLLVSDEGLDGRLVGRLARKGALAVLSSDIAHFTRDPSGGDAHLDAIQFRSVSRSTRLPVAQISPRSHARLRELARTHPDLSLRLRAEVEWTEAPLRTLVARVLGDERPDEVVVLASHVQEPGAGDNASGVAGLCEVASAVARDFERPARTLVFLWGDEMRQSSIYLRHTKRRVVAGISADMLGQSRERTGAICLLERAPDPGALDTLPPDQHTPWGAGRVREEDLIPSGLALVGRVALADTGRRVGGWETSENPWEGGSDHDVFLKSGVPAVLFWHFTDFTYHTSLDRMDRIDLEELRRTSCAILATALTVADLRRADLARLQASNALERELRVAAALEAGRPDVAMRWREWCHSVDEWLIATCVDATDD